MENVDVLIECIAELTEEVRLLRKDLRPELEKTASVEQRRKLLADTSQAACDFLSKNSHDVKTQTIGRA